MQTRLDGASAAFAAAKLHVASAGLIDQGENVLEIALPECGREVVRDILHEHFPGADMLVAAQAIAVPHLLVSDMDSTIIQQECIDELADFAGLKDRVSAITERAMRGELDFADALHERVGLLQGLPEDAITRCLAERIVPTPGARALVATLRSKGCRCVLVTGGFHHFADPVAEMTGFERVVGNRLAVSDGTLTGGLVGAVSDSSTKARVLSEERERLGEGALTMALGDGANDAPMLATADFGLAYRAKPAAREAAGGQVESDDLTVILRLLGIPRTEWVAE